MHRIIAYAFRLKREVALVSAAEYHEIDDALTRMYAGLKAGDLGEKPLLERHAEHPAAHEALAIYRRITGRDFDGIAAELMYTQISLYGRICPECEKPFRTPRSKFCAECGYDLPEGEVAGPLVRT